MNRKTIYAILLAAVAVALIVLLIKLVGGAYSVMSGALNTVLGVVLSIALVGIWIWMFLYARKR